ncbi:MAG: DUF6340 family protein [Paludibacter sp.]|nr:DUF6340 family protein [Paludibacter sp.]
MRFILKNILLVLLGLFLASCSEMLYTNIEVLRPAKITFPADIDRVLIINNSKPQAHDYGHVTELFNEKKRKLNIDTDSLAIYSIASFAESVQEKEFFSSVDVTYNSIKNAGDFLSTTPPPQSEIAELAEKSQANAVISLDRILVNDNVSELFNQEENTFLAYMEARYEKHWTIHFPEKHQVLNLVTKDTVYWESESYYRQRAMNGLPVRRDALIDGALITGSRDVNKFIPYWEKVDRYFFNFKNKTFKPGMDAVYKKDWDGAISCWEKLLPNAKSETYKAKIAHDLAVAYEIKEDIEKAYEYSNKALEFFMNSIIIDYQHFMFVVEHNNMLKLRLADQKILKKQLGE